MANIFLIDDHPAVRQGLRLVLSKGPWIICGEASSISETKEKIGLSGANIALLDLSLGDGDGCELIAKIRERAIAVLIYSMHEDAGTIEKAFGSGANGYVSKRDAAAILPEAVSEVLAGERYVSPRVAQSLASKAISSSESNGDSTLTERELQILNLLGRGESNLDIASTLFISVRTVETHYARMIAKLNFNSMKELRRHAINRP